MDPETRQSQIGALPLLQQSPQQLSSIANTATIQAQQQQPNPAKEHTTIWQGFLEWNEKQKGPPEGQKIARQVQCHVTASGLNGEAEVKGDGWPPKLIMQFIPKGIVGILGGGYFRDVKTILFRLQPIEALESMTRVLDNGFAGCVHFTGTNMNPNCTIKVLILLYSKERNAYLGFIPNDQAGFVDSIRKLIQQHKSLQASMGQHQGRPGGEMMQPQSLGPGGTVAENLPPEIHAQMQQGNMPTSVQQEDNIPVGQGNISSMQQGSISMQEGNMPHGNMPGQMGQSGMQGNIQAGNHLSSMQGNMPPGMQHSDTQSMQSGMQPGLQPEAMARSTLQQTLQQSLQAATLQQQVLVKQQQELVKQQQKLVKQLQMLVKQQQDLQQQ